MLDGIEGNYPTRNAAGLTGVTGALSPTLKELADMW